MVWKLEKLNDVCIVERGSSPRPIKKYLTYKDDGVNWIKIGDTKNIKKYIYETNQKITPEGALKSRKVEVGDFILSNSMSFGRPYIMKTSGYIHDGWFVLRLREDLDSEYFYHLLSSNYVQKQFVELAAGAIVKNISGDLVKKTILPIPPLPEQKRIVEILDEAFAGIDQAIENTEKNLINARELFESILDQTLNRKDISRTNTTLGESCEFFNGKAHEKAIDENGEYIVVNSKFISTEGQVVKRTNEQMFPLVVNDITMVMSDVPNGKALVKCYVIDENDKYSLNQRICCIKSDKYLTEYLYFQLNRHPYLLAFDNKGSQANLRKDDILSCPLYMPEINEQQEIVKKLSLAKSNARNLETTYQQKLTALKELKQSLLQKAFSGELTSDMREAA